MKALLLGFGDIAQRTARLLLEQDWVVEGLRRSSKAAGGVVMHSGDSTDARVLESIVAGQDVVIASFTPDEFSEAGYRAAYLDTAKALARVMEMPTNRPKRLIWVSSTSVYGAGNGDWVDEETPPVPSRYSGRILLEAEQVLEQSDGAVTIVRFSGIYGRGAPRLIEQVKSGQCVPETPIQWTNRIHCDDCAGILAHLCNRVVSGEDVDDLYLATDCEPVPLHQVHQWMASQMGVEVVKGGKLGSMRGNRRCSNSKLLATGYSFNYPTYKEGYLPFTN